MSFSWPYLLLALLLVPVLVGIYLWMLRRRRKFAVRYGSLLLVRAALPRRSRWRRHVPFALLLLAVASLAVAMARPQATIAVPMSRTSIILALDVSRSMCATDVEPNRLAVAQETAREFVEDRAGETRIGIVAFGGVAQLVVPPTTDKNLLIEAIDGFTTGRGTAVGTAILRAIDAIAEVNPDVARAGLEAGDGSSPAGAGYEPDVVVLLTDGATTQGISPILAAEQAAQRRVRVYTIGFGTTELTPLVCSREQMGSDVFGPQFGGGGQFGPGGQFGGGGGGGNFQRFLLLDEETLQAVADMTGGAYHRAEDADQLVEVFRELPAEITRQDEEREVSVAFAGLGGLLVTLAVGLSLAWNRYP